MDLQITHLPVSESPYRVLVTSQYSSCHGELTRDPRDGVRGKRSILRIDERCFAKLVGPNAWPMEVRELLEQMRRGANGSIRAAKGRVLEISNNPDPRLGVAIHKYGPVPTVLIPDAWFSNGPRTLDLDDEQIIIRFAIYPDLARHAGRSNEVNGGSTVADCLRSYFLGLDVILLKYIEDVAHDLYDIEHHLSFIGAVRRARAAEGTIAGSVKGKLEQVRTHLAAKDSFLNPLARGLFQKYDDWIILASHVRVYVLFMLNEYYALHDVRSKEKYLNDWNALRARAANDGRYSQIADEHFELQKLVSAFAAYQGGNLGELDAVLKTSKGWVSKLISFARYVLGLRSDKLRAASPKIFFSGRHKNDETTTSFLRMKDHFLDSRSERPIEMVHVEATPSGDRIDWTIKRRISACHALICVITREDEAHLGYLIKEVEHASRRDEAFPVHLLVEEGVKLPDVRSAFGSYIEYFPPLDVRINLPQRQQFLSERIGKVGFLRFRELGNWVISGDLKRDLDLIGTAARERFVFDRIHGLVQFVTPEHRLVLKLAMKHAGSYQRSKEWLCARIAQDMGETAPRVKSMFTGAWVAQKKRALLVDKSEYSLFTQPENGKYQPNIRFIVRKLWPDLGSGPELDNLVRRLIDGIE